MILIFIAGIILVTLSFNNNLIGEKTKKWFLILGFVAILLPIIVTTVNFVNMRPVWSSTSKYHDAIVNKMAETKLFYKQEEEVFGKEVSVKILTIGQYEYISSKDRDELINNNTDLKQKNINIKNSCFVEYQKIYQGTQTGNVVTNAIFTRPVYIQTQKDSQNLILGDSYLKRDRQDNSLISYSIFDCSGQNQSGQYRVGFNPCKIRSGCLDGGEFYSEEADDWRINRSVYKTFEEYIRPVEFVVDLIPCTRSFNFFSQNICLVK